MEALFKINMLDTFNIQQGNHFNDMVNEYSTITKAVNPDKNIEDSNTTHLYKEGLQRKYYGMVESLWNSGLLKEDVKVIDLGCGLCTTLYNIMRQFKSYDIPANFYGIEHNEELFNTFVKYLDPLWGNNNLSFCVGDMMKCDISDYDLILTYQSFKKLEDVNNMYNKVFKEMKVSSVFHEHMINGAKFVNKLDDCKQLILNNANNNNMEEKVLLFGGEKQTLFIKR